MEGFEGLWFDCEIGDQGVTSVEQVKMLPPILQYIRLSSNCTVSRHGKLSSQAH